MNVDTQLFRRSEAYFERSRLANQVYKKPELMDPCMILSNCLVTTLEIIDLFWENRVAVDVDNDYKIVYFDQRTPNTPKFQERFSMAHPDRDRDVFLRAHFNYSLLVNMIGGDVRDDFMCDEPDTFADMMDLYGDPIDLSGDLAEEWGTPIGRKVREWLLAHQ
ncbi:hypothetical protein Hypma_007346 [Hypsizygus marmoreus]|uniref:Uncharacterized protein n=1 Tax=Hypsizygus marmoreus TaxID=39966 RepID=A0A369JRG1_HYPMA|nr:hypothetical protein Hypma_007346 [Hypsizygus marmoreus]